MCILIDEDATLVLSAGKTESFAFGLFFVYQQSAIPLKKIIDKYNGEASN
jgi:hypothetical protein